MAYQINVVDEQNRNQEKFHTRVKLVTWGEVKRSNIIKLQSQSQFQRFLYETSHKSKDRKILNGIFILLLGSCMPQGRDFGVLGSKTLARGFVMAPHRL